VANLVQRYNPLYEPVQSIVQERLLGDPLHAYFENYAKDEPLGPNHWFWDRGKSGGIFVEHGVHFFDMFHGWLGEGRVEAAQRVIRPGTDIEEQVQCTVRYGADVLANFYHGFHQPARLDRQELRLVFERGDIALHGWIPVGASVEAIVDRETRKRIEELFPDATMGVVDSYEGDEKRCSGRHKDMTVDEEIRLMTPEGIDKEKRYGEMINAMVQDQVAWIRDRSHERKITAENGRESLRIALEADRMAR
jgi:predicted dehydrogenase